MPAVRSVRRAGAIAALALVLAVVPAANASAASASTAALQVALKALHHYDGAIDGIRGPLTNAGVLEFQRAHHLAVDGIVGSQTRHALGWRGRPSLGDRTVRRHQKGWDVSEVQFLLVHRGFSPGAIDGGFGHYTDYAVHRFQRYMHVSADGMVGPVTLGLLIHGRPSSSSGSGYPSGPVRFYRPVSAPITSPFGWRWGRMHTGVDFGASYGTRIGAGGVGRVVYAGWNSGGYGYLVIVQHRLGYQSWYAHMSRIATHVGAYVSGGSTLGYVGATGHAFGAHLHFEVRHDGVPIDPIPYLLSGTAAKTYGGAPAPDGGATAPDDADGCAPDSGPDLDPKTARQVDCKTRN